MRRLILIPLLLGFSFSAQSANWTWAGFEIVGQKNVSKAKIQSLIPIKIGSPFEDNKLLWDQWCMAIQAKYNFIYAECGAVRYGDFKAYFTVELVEKGDEYRLAFRDEPAQSLPLANQKVIKEFEALQSRLWTLFEKGQPPIENALKGYLDYDDLEMSQMVQHLIKWTPKYRDNLIRVLKQDKDPEKRAKAATLLNWAQNTEDSISKVHSLVNDPRELVRNNISRFMMHYFDKVKNTRILKEVIKSLSKQLWYPSFGDRNKAIFGLLAIAKNHPQIRSYIKLKAIRGIQFLAKNSILNNVQVPAQQLLELINEK